MAKSCWISKYPGRSHRGAKIVAYFADNTDAGFLNAITTAVHDSTNNPSVVSISWGGPESSWTQQAMTSMDEAFQSAAAMGVTVCVAAGDDGSTDGVTDGLNHVDFPCIQSQCAGLWRHTVGGLGQYHHQRNGVERTRE
jgi:kumamolisin